MAERVRPASIGVGAAFRRAREIAGVTLEQAARDTKLRPEQLHALEAEEFDDLGEEVYVRAMVRTYAGYLGLEPDRVAAAYAKHAEEPTPPPPPQRTGKLERKLAANHVRNHQLFLLVAAAVVLVTLVAVGVVSRSGAPEAADIPSVAVTASAPVATGGVGVEVRALEPVTVRAIVDGVAQEPARLAPTETVAYVAEATLDLRVSDGGAVELTRDGRPLGIPGEAGKPWQGSFAAEGAS